MRWPFGERGRHGVAVGFLALALTGCDDDEMRSATSRDELEVLLGSLASAWARQDTPAALACFTDDAVYMQPPDQQLYRGHGDLQVLFDALEPGTFMEFHELAFDADSQTGFAEFSFGRSGSETAVHGIVRIVLADGRIASWREYFESGPMSFDEFIAVDGKDWKWTADSMMR